MWKAHAYAFAGLLRSHRGDVGIMTIVGVAILVVAYASYPQGFYDFFQWVHQTIQGSADNNFDKYGHDPATGKPGQVAVDGGPTGVGGAK